jgi:hypothetical protein
VILEGSDLDQEEYEGEKWDRVLMFLQKHPSLLPKIIPGGSKAKHAKPLLRPKLKDAPEIKVEADPKKSLSQRSMRSNRSNRSISAKGKIEESAFIAKSEGPMPPSLFQRGASEFVPEVGSFLQKPRAAGNSFSVQSEGANNSMRIAQAYAHSSALDKRRSTGA